MSQENLITLHPTTESFPDENIGNMTSERPQDPEVGGRAIVLRLARCGVCGNTGYVAYDTVNYRAYKCNSCHTCVGGDGH